MVSFRIKVSRAFNGVEALKLIINSSVIGQNFDIIFMDCNMPLMDGY